MEEYFQLLGFKVKDVVTGFEGVAESISFDLYGCIQYVVRAEFSKDAKEEAMKAQWFDAKRLKAISQTPVMPAPSFYILARLDRDGHSELAAKVRAGKLSANKAAIEAGFRKPPMVPIDHVLKWLPKLLDNPPGGSEKPAYASKPAC